MSKQSISWLVLLLVALAVATFVSLDAFRSETAEESLNEVNVESDNGAVDLENSGFIDEDAPEFID